MFLQVPSSGDRLNLTAWTRPEPVPAWALDLDPPFRLRLSAGIPQVLTGPERTDLKSFCAKLGVEAGLPLALPLVAQPRTLLGAIVLLDTPPFDLEDEEFLLAWTQYKYTLIHSLQPRRKSIPPYSEASLMRTLDEGHGFLTAELDTTELVLHGDRMGLPPQRLVHRLLRNVSELTGAHGAVLWRPPLLTALFVLPGRMDRDLLWHQIEVSLAWPEGFKPHWSTRVLRTPQELQRTLGR